MTCESKILTGQVRRPMAVAGRTRAPQWIILFLVANQIPFPTVDSTGASPGAHGPSSPRNPEGNFRAAERRAPVVGGPAGSVCADLIGRLRGGVDVVSGTAMEGHAVQDTGLQVDRAHHGGEGGAEERPTVEAMVIESPMAERKRHDSTGCGLLL